MSKTLHPQTVALVPANSYHMDSVELALKGVFLHLAW